MARPSTRRRDRSRSADSRDLAACTSPGGVRDGHGNHLRHHRRRVIGLLGKFVAPGDKDNIPIWLTILCGIGGVILGWFVYAAFGGDGSSGVDWVRWIVAVVVAAVLVVIASTLTGRNTGARARH